MAQSVVVQIGQCGNQIGSKFWDLALAEHSDTTHLHCDDAVSTFFDVNSSAQKSQENIHPKDLRARCVMIDMEEGVVNNIVKKSRNRYLFDKASIVSDVSGSGNNWAVGFYDYGDRYEDKIRDAVRTEIEKCDCLQCFFIIHSMGGGTGSGLGTRTLQILEDNFGDVYRFVTSVYPDGDDDVITSPYNSLLASHQHIEHADCVIPVHNSQLINLIDKHKLIVDGGQAKKRSFDLMNSIVSECLLDLTAGSRFDGSLNVDLNEIVTNLVPFPRLHFLHAGKSPLTSSPSARRLRTTTNQLLKDSVSSNNQLTLALDPTRSQTDVYLAAAALFRGDATLGDVSKAIAGLRRDIRFVTWNDDSWKVGLCGRSSSQRKQDVVTSCLSLVNNTRTTALLNGVHKVANKLLKSKAYLHHYTKVSGMDMDQIETAFDSVADLASSYDALGNVELDILPELKIL